MNTEKAKTQLRIMLAGPAASYATHSPAIKKVLDELEAKDKRIKNLILYRRDFCTLRTAGGHPKGR
ncbi:hypothetical protein ACK6WA_21315 [Escherichia coli]